MGGAFGIGVGDHERDFSIGRRDFRFRAGVGGPFDRLFRIFIGEGHGKVLDQLEFPAAVGRELGERFRGKVGLEFESVPHDFSYRGFAITGVIDFPGLGEFLAKFFLVIGRFFARRAGRSFRFGAGGRGAIGYVGIGRFVACGETCGDYERN